MEELDSIGLVELSSVARGYTVEDAMIKAANVKIIMARTICSGKLRARSFLPVALAASVATGVRIYFVGWKPLFPMPSYKLTGTNELWLFALLGVFMGIVGIAMIRVLSWLEDFFDDLPIKRALIWSPVIGALSSAASATSIRRCSAPATTPFATCSTTVCLWDN